MADRFQTPIDLPILSSDPTNPSAGYVRWYSKSDGKSYQRDPAGTVLELTNGVHENPLTFTNGLSRSGDTISNTFYIGDSTNQTLIGATTSAGTLTLSSTAHGTKGKILFGTSAYDEVNNRLGIGTTAPGFPLEISASIPQINLSASTGTNLTAYRMVNSGGTSWFGLESSAGGSILPGSTAYATVITTNSSNLQFGTANLTRMTITNTGNVGIGTTNPVALLHVVGGVILHTNYGTQVSTRGLNAGYFSSAQSLSLYSGSAGDVVLGPGSDVVTIKSGGNVGIGTTAPSARLHSLAITEQLRLGYDASNYLSTTINSTGSATFDLTGTSPEFTFSDPVNVPDEVYGVGWDGSLEVPTKNAVYDKIETLGDSIDDYLAARAELGDIGKYTPVGISPFLANAGALISDGFQYFFAVYIPKTDTITGVCWMQQNSYDFVADHNNKVGLYSYSGGTLTLIANSANDGDVWKSGTGRRSKAFTASVVVNKGIYYIAVLLNGSSGTIQANITRSTSGASAFANNGFANSAILHGNLSGQTDLAGPTLNINTLTPSSSENRVFQLY